MNRLVLILVTVFVVFASATTFVLLAVIPDYRTTVLVDTSTQTTDFPGVLAAVTATAHNIGTDDSLSLRRFGGECGSPDNTAELTDDPSAVGSALRGVRPSGRPTLLSGILAAIDDFDGVLPFHGTKRNRIVIISSTGLDACSGDPAAVSRTIQEHVRSAGLALELRVIGHRVPPDQRDALKQVAGDQPVAFTESAADLSAELDTLVIPRSPEAAKISVTAPPPAEPVFAFGSSTGMGIVRGEKVVKQVTRKESESQAWFRPAFTSDGRYVFTTVAEGVLVIEVSSGAERTVPCDQCQTAVPAGESLIVWLDSGDRMVVLDASKPDASPRSVAVPFPPRQFPTELGGGHVEPIGGRAGHVVIAWGDGTSAYGGPETIYDVDLDGSRHDLGNTTDEANVAVGIAAIAPDGKLIAIPATEHAGACESVTAVALIDPPTQEHRRLAVVDPKHPQADVNGSSVRDLWFDHDGGLNAIYTDRHCDSTGGDATIVQDVSLWHLTPGDDHWELRDAGPLLSSRDVAPGVRAVIVDPDSDRLSGTVHVKTADRDINLGVQASSLAVPD
ncbi:hypothetical protein [Actinokineospora enzanensis]|uniref:hypothetical protein n=1 Tax=Actinokineospora enzanensis TaxID=155975 RepID=UPI00036BFED7|nr:hypothetical protein [Actinokineospora enzanensis]